MLSDVSVTRTHLQSEVSMPEMIFLRCLCSDLKSKKK
jgi:hypothetical protein